MERNTDEFSFDVSNFEREHERMQMQKRVMNPGEQVREMLEKWGREEPDTEEAIVKHAVRVICANIH